MAGFTNAVEVKLRLALDWRSPHFGSAEACGPRLVQYSAVIPETKGCGMTNSLFNDCPIQYANYKALPN